MEALEQYRPLTEINNTARFITYKGQWEHQPVCVKVPVSEETKDKLAQEAAGLISMQELDPEEQFYATPSLVRLATDHIVTSWAEGRPMKLDFKAGNERVASHLDYLGELFAFIDRQSSGGDRLNRFSSLSVDHNGDSMIQKLQSVDFDSHINPELMQDVAAYASSVANTVDSRFTHGNLQPGNILLPPSGLMTVVDFESCSWSWPRHYNAVNFIFNYGARYQWLQPQLPEFFQDYCRNVEVDASSQTDTFNLSAAMRCLQIVYEKLKPQAGIAPKAELNPQIKQYVEATAERIVRGELFFDSTR